MPAAALNIEDPRTRAKRLNAGDHAQSVNISARARID
jgi:hypothetical protein